MADDEQPKQKRGRPPKRPEDKAPKKSGKSGVHKPPSAEQIARLDAVVATVTADVPADITRGRVALAERRLGLRVGALSVGQSRSVVDATIEAWEAAASEYLRARH